MNLRDLAKEERYKEARLPSPATRDPGERVVWTLARFDEEQGVLIVRSRILGAEVVFAANEAEIPEGETRPVYRVRELRELLKFNPDPESLRRIHRVKTLFNGTVVGEELR